MATVEPDRTRGRWRPTRIAVLAGLVIAAGLVGFAGIREALQNSDARDALSDYLKDVQRGNYTAAYDQLCTSVLPGYSEQDHELFLESQPPFVAFDLDNATSSTSTQGTEVTFSVHFTDANGQTRVARMSVDLEDKGPRVCDGPQARTLE